MKKEIITISICSPLKGLWKSHQILKHIPPNICSPIAFITKAKHASQEDFDAVLNYLKKGAEK